MSSTRVLIIDDDEPTRMVMQLMLSRAGYVIELAVDARQAFEIADQFDPEVIILDMSMPGMNGLVFAQEYRRLAASQQRRNPIIIGVSVEEQYFQEAAASGIDDFLVKPFYADQLVNTIVRHLNP